MGKCPGSGVGREEGASERLVARAEGRVAIGHRRLETHSCWGRGTRTGVWAAGD